MNDKIIAGHVLKSVSDEQMSFKQTYRGEHTERSAAATISTLIALALAATLFCVFHFMFQVAWAFRISVFTFGFITLISGKIWLRPGFTNVFFYGWKARAIACFVIFLAFAME